MKHPDKSRIHWSEPVSKSMLWDIGMGVFLGILLADAYHYFVYGI